MTLPADYPNGVIRCACNEYNINLLKVFEKCQWNNSADYYLKFKLLFRIVKRAGFE